ncbi:MAG: signal peptidase [Thermoleophilaceae bacterium]|jgi:signal peptidase II|nr:signal peptidase [Thermoleophilaceae bacterium]
MTRGRGWALALATVGVTVAVDQMTKAWVRASVDPHERINVFFGIDITRVKNTGVAFGALAGSGTLVLIAVMAAMAGLLVYFTLHMTAPALWLPVGMVFGGALGNLADRVRIDGVTDFIDPVLWPAFNVADMCIVAGVLGVLYLAEAKK